MLAILEDAIAVFVRSLNGGAVRRSEACAARAWLESRDRTTPFGFESICDVLGLESDYIRHGLRTVRARPAEAAARLVGRHRGRSPGPATPPGAPRMSVVAGRSPRHASATGSR